MSRLADIKPTGGSRTIFVTRHPGAREWLARHLAAEQIVDHLSADRVRPTDLVIGTLPIQQIARLQVAGIRFIALCFDMPAAWRGRELDADEIESLGPELVEFDVVRKACHHP